VEPVSRPALSPPGALQWFADGRGLTGVGGVLLAACLGLVGLLLGIATGNPVGTAFAVCFVAGCAAAAVLIRHEGLLTAVLLPPLLFVTLAAIASVLDGSRVGASWLVRRGLDIVTAVVTQAPVLFTAVLAVVAIAALRFVRFRAGVRRGRPAPRGYVHRPATPG